MLLKMKRKDLIELGCIAGIVAVIAFVEVNFGILAEFTRRLNEMWSGMNSYGYAILLGGWIGVCFYSLRRRADLQRETEARKSVEADFASEKITDRVTGLPNRMGFQLVLDAQLKERGDESYTVLGVEICNLDSITSVHGSEATTRVEIAMADHLTGHLGGGFLARGGRAVFYGLVSGDSIDETRFWIDNVIEETAQFSSAGIEANGIKLQTFVTFGVLNIDGETCRGPEWNAENVMRRVDYAGLRARRLGNEAVETFDWNMESDMHQRAIIEASLGNAIQSGQIVPHFQPLIDLSTHKVTGLEILARWDHPAQGDIPPSTFIPIAEDTGVLRNLTLSVLRQACMAAVNWPEHITLALNISPTDLRDASIIDKFMAIFEETGVSPDRIEVEITENALVEEAGSISGAIDALKREGMSLSLDDFGTGYSSLRHLRILPFDKIKIDQSFVRDMSSNKESKAIVQAIIAMAQSLGLKTTAEGIEVELNEDMLQDFGCTIGQGFLYAKALPAAEVLPFLERYEQQVAPAQAVA